MIVSFFIISNCDYLSMANDSHFSIAEKRNFEVIEETSYGKVSRRFHEKCKQTTDASLRLV